MKISDVEIGKEYAAGRASNDGNTYTLHQRVRVKRIAKMKKQGYSYSSAQTRAEVVVLDRHTGEPLLDHHGEEILRIYGGREILRLWTEELVLREKLAEKNAKIAAAKKQEQDSAKEEFFELVAFLEKVAPECVKPCEYTAGGKDLRSTKMDFGMYPERGSQVKMSQGTMFKILKELVGAGVDINEILNG